MIKNNIDLNAVKQGLLDENGSITKVAKKLNVDYHAIRNLIMKHNLPFNNERKPITATKEQLQEAYDRLGTVDLVAKEFGCSDRGIGVKMKKFGIKFNFIYKYTCDDDFFSRDTEEAFYWAGFIAADGCVMANGKNKKDISVLSIGVAIKDEQHLINFQNLINHHAPIHYSIRKGREVIENRNGKLTKRFIKDSKMSSISISSRKIINDIKRFGVVARKSLIYSCPKEIINHKLFHHFMRGYFDGDGCVSLDSNTNNLHFQLLGTFDFLTACKEIFENKLISNNITQLVKRNNIYELNYGGNILTKRIYDYLYKDAKSYLQRKYDKFQHVQNCGSKIVLSDLVYMIEKQKNRKGHNIPISILLNEDDWASIYKQTHENMTEDELDIVLLNDDIFTLPFDSLISISKQIDVRTKSKRFNGLDIGYVKFIPGRIHAMKIILEPERNDPNILPEYFRA